MKRSAIVLFWIVSCFSAPPTTDQQAPSYTEGYGKFSLNDTACNDVKESLEPKSQTVDDKDRVNKAIDLVADYERRIQYESLPDFFPFEMNMEHVKNRTLLFLSWGRQRLLETTWKELWDLCATERPKTKKEMRGKAYPDQLVLKLATRASHVKNEADIVLGKELEIFQDELDYILANSSEYDLIKAPFFKRFAVQLMLGNVRESCGDWLFDKSPPEPIMDAIEQWNLMPTKLFWKNMADIVRKTYPTRMEQIMMLNAIIHFTEKSKRPYRYKKTLSKLSLIRDLMDAFKKGLFLTVGMYERIADRTDIPRDVGAHLLQLALANVLYANPKSIASLWRPFNIQWKETKRFPGTFNFDILPKPFSINDFDRRNVRFLGHHYVVGTPSYPFTIPRGSIAIKVADRWFVTWSYLFDETAKKVISYNDFVLKSAPPVPDIKWLISIRNFFFFHVNDGKYQHLVKHEPGDREVITYEKSLNGFREFLDFYQIYDLNNSTRKAFLLLANELPEENDIFQVLEGLKNNAKFLLSDHAVHGGIFLFVTILMNLLLGTIASHLTQIHVGALKTTEQGIINSLKKYRRRFFLTSVEIFSKSGEYPNITDDDKRGYFIFFDSGLMNRPDYGKVLDLTKWQIESEDVKQGRLFFEDEESRQFGNMQAFQRHQKYLDTVIEKDLEIVRYWISSLRQCVEEVAVTVDIDKLESHD